MTYTRLYIGEPFISGTPRGDVPCTEPRVTGSNLMGALGTFETSGSEFQYAAWNPFIWPYNEDVAGDRAGWGFAQGSDAYDANLTSIARTTDNPRSGARALRVVYGSDDTTSRLFLAGGKRCGSYVQTASGPVSFRADPGDLITFSIWYEVNWTTTGPVWGIDLECVTENGTTPIDAAQDDGSTTDVGTFAQLSTSIVAPATTYWCRLAIRISGGGTFDFDDAVLSIS